MKIVKLKTMFRLLVNENDLRSWQHTKFFIDIKSFSKFSIYKTI
jgi:hypothetical protein